MNRDLPGLIKGVSAEAADSENPALRLLYPELYADGVSRWIRNVC